MTYEEQLNKFIEDNITLLEQGLFFELYTTCPRVLRGNLLQLLDKADIPITDTSHKYYGFRGTDNDVCIIIKYNKKSDFYDYEFKKVSSNIPQFRNRMVISDNLKDVLEFAAWNYRDPVVMNPSVVSSMNIVPVNVPYKNTYMQMYVSQVGVDMFDTVKSKERRFQAAAKQELDDRLIEYTKSVFNMDRFRSKLAPFTEENNVYYVSIQVYPAELLISLDQNPDIDRSAVEDIIIKEVNSPVDIVWENDVDSNTQISVKLKSPRVDTIKKEVEDLFGVSL